MNEETLRAAFAQGQSLGYIAQHVTYEAWRAKQFYSRDFEKWCEAKQNGEPHLSLTPCDVKFLKGLRISAD